VSDYKLLKKDSTPWSWLVHTVGNALFDYSTMNESQL